MSAAGTWNLVMQTPIGERKSTLTLQEAGGALTGKMAAEGGPRPPEFLSTHPSPETRIQRIQEHIAANGYA